MGERLDQRHRLLQVDVVVRRAVDQIEHFILEQMRFFADVRFVVSFVIVSHVRKAHVALGVGGIW